MNRRSGFTLVEMLVVIVVISILVSLLLPVIGAAKARARQAACASNQHQVWLAWTRASSRDATRPVVAKTWTDRVGTYVVGKDVNDTTRGPKDVFFCPDDLQRPATVPTSFGMNDRAQWFSGQDGGRIVLLDFKTSRPGLVPDQQLAVSVVVPGQTNAALAAAWQDGLAPRHFLGVNVTFFDGHAGSFAPQDIDPSVLKPGDCDHSNFTKYWRPVHDSQIPCPQ